MAAEISDYQKEKDTMMALRQKVAIMEEDVAKEKGRVTGKNIGNCITYDILTGFL